MFWQGKGTVVRLGGACALGLALVCVCGCSKGKATVNGKVTFNNQPVGVGTVTFWTSDNRSAQAPLKPDGSYSMPDAPVGEVKITVTTPPPKMGPMTMEKPPPGMKGMPADMIPEGAGDAANPGKMKIVPIPDKYKEVSTTPLTYTVTKGTNEFNIILTP